MADDDNICWIPRGYHADSIVADRAKIEINECKEYICRLYNKLTPSPPFPIRIPLIMAGSWTVSFETLSKHLIKQFTLAGYDVSIDEIQKAVGARATLVLDKKKPASVKRQDPKVLAVDGSCDASSSSGVQPPPYDSVINVIPSAKRVKHVENE